MGHVEGYLPLHFCRSRFMEQIMLVCGRPLVGTLIVIRSLLSIGSQYYVFLHLSLWVIVLRSHLETMPTFHGMREWHHIVYPLVWSNITSISFSDPKAFKFNILILSTRYAIFITHFYCGQCPLFCHPKIQIIPPYQCSLIELFSVIQLPYNTKIMILKLNLSAWCTFMFIWVFQQSRFYTWHSAILHIDVAGQHDMMTHCQLLCTIHTEFVHSSMYENDE